MSLTTSTEQKEPVWLPAIEKLAEFTYLEIALAIVLLISYIWRKIVFFHLFQSRFRLLRSIEENRQIEGILYRILEAAEADRVILYQFHNGERLASGQHFVYLSATHEVVKPGISPVSRRQQRILVSRISKDLDLIKDGKLHLILAEEQETPCQVFLASINVEALYSQMLFSGDKPLGIISIEYVYRPANKIDPDKLKKLVYQLTSILAHPPILYRLLSQ